MNQCKLVLFITILFLNTTFILAQRDEKVENISTSFDSTGYFYLAQDKSRHFFIDPHGRPYLALGLNHFHNMTFTNYDSIVEVIKHWGFTAGGYQGPKWIWTRYPHTKGINVLKTTIYRSGDRFGYEDVFAPEFLNTIEERISEVVKPMAGNNLLIGYFLTDLPVWSRTKNGGWLSFIKSLRADAPGAKVFKTWKEHNPELDEKLFTAVIASHVYKHAHEIIRKYDKNHLIFGDRFHDVDIPTYIVEAELPYVDAIAVQPSSQFDKVFFDQLYQAYGKPIYIADHVSSFATSEHPTTMGQVAENETDYLIYYEKTIQNITDLPYVVGFNKCQFQDEIRPNLLKQGLVKANGATYERVVEVVRDANLSALEKFQASVKRK